MTYPSVFETRREYVHVGSTAASLPLTVSKTNEQITFLKGVVL